MEDIVWTLGWKEIGGSVDKKMGMRGPLRKNLGTGQSLSWYSWFLDQSKILMGRATSRYNLIRGVTVQYYTAKFYFSKECVMMAIPVTMQLKYSCNASRSNGALKRMTQMAMKFCQECVSHALSNYWSHVKWPENGCYRITL